MPVAVWAVPNAQLFARRGAKVVVNDIGRNLFGQGMDASPAEETVNAIKAEGGEALANVSDLSTETGSRNAVRAAINAYGRIDVLVHNAGFALPHTLFEDETLTRSDAQLDVNTRAAFCLIQEAWPVMIKQKYGRIVLAASAAIHGASGSIPYSMAKSSYIGLTRGLAAEGMPNGIKINAVEPAAASRMSESMESSEFRTWFLKTMKPEYVSAVVGFLAHETCSVTGEFIISAGGRVGRTVFADTIGYVGPAQTIEEVRDNFEFTMSDQRYLYPKDGIEATAQMASSLGMELSETLTNVSGHGKHDE